MRWVALLAFGCVSWADRPPNVLFVLTDDMGWGDVSYNKEYIQPGPNGVTWTPNPPRTPNIDRIALGENTMLFRRFYAGSCTCSPTRASLLSGRTPDRECIDSAEGCGQSPAWKCYDTLPFPPVTFTVAEAAKIAGYSTAFFGKWHLGDFWVKGEKQNSPAMKKWPSSNPGMHGFDEWHATEASAASCTTNCGCVGDWKNEGQGCITGGGVWKNAAYDCTNYWRPADLNASHASTRPECHHPNTTTRDCVANLTEKITGDDSQYMMTLVDEFLSRKAPGLNCISSPQEPHPAMPEWYHAYKDAFGNDAGDYLGTISQMDAAIGTLDGLLEKHGVMNNTMLWYTHDNGASPGGRGGGQVSAANGLRQCKGSIFEGGIREPGFVRWPDRIMSHQETMRTTVTVDFLPTFMEMMQIKHPHPDWAMDGTSIFGLLNGTVSTDTLRPSAVGFSQSGQWAVINETTQFTWKVVQGPEKGRCVFNFITSPHINNLCRARCHDQRFVVVKETERCSLCCVSVPTGDHMFLSHLAEGHRVSCVDKVTTRCSKFEPPYNKMKKPCTPPCVFELRSDPTESDDLCTDSKNATAKAICATMRETMTEFLASVTNSRLHESQCSDTKDPLAAIRVPATPPSGGLGFVTEEGLCLTLMPVLPHGVPVIGDCNGGSRWDVDPTGGLRNLDRPYLCVKHDGLGEGRCVSGTTLWLGECGTDEDVALSFDATSGHLRSEVCGLCAKLSDVNEVISITSAALALTNCDDPDVIKLSKW